MTGLPTLNAILNAITAALLVGGYVLIRRGEREKHRRVMLMAFGVSTLFLISYLIYHYNVGSVRYRGGFRTVYLAILFSHTVLAAAVPPLAIITLTRGLRGRFEKHRQLARWTLPIWLYVSVTGVVVYVMLYRL